MPSCSLTFKPKFNSFDVARNMPAVDASIPRELLDVTGDGGARDERRRNAVNKITLAAVLGGSEKKHGNGRSQMSRTLLDIIADDENQSNRNSWSSFKDRIRRRTGSAAWTSSVHIPTSDVPMRSSSGGGHISRQQSTRFQTVHDDDDKEDESTRSQVARAGQNRRTQMSRMSSTRFPRVTFDLNESTHEDSNESPSPPPSRENFRVETESEAHHVTGTRLAASKEGEQPPPPPKMSLMALLEETDRQMGVVGPTYAEPTYDDEDEEENEDEDEDGNSEDEDGRRRGGEFSCCVCMVKHKGAGFMPCGHTFCRLCSRELWVSRGNCPICNGFILEILHIF